MKKIIGLSTGRKNSNSEILLTEAAKGADTYGMAFIPMFVQW
jgi:multimeric flavodoxin WrbA